MFALNSKMNFYVLIISAILATPWSEREVGREGGRKEVSKIDLEYAARGSLVRVCSLAPLFLQTCAPT